MGGFPQYIRKQVFARDDATCQRCYKNWYEGWMLQIIHIKEGEDGLNNALLCCIACHIADHKNKWAKATDNVTKAKHLKAIRLLEQTDERNYLYYKTPH